MERKLIFLDIDGTIRTFEAGIRKEVKEGLKKLRANGHQIFVCTGRSHVMFPEELDESEVDGVISSAGSDIRIHGKNVYQKGLEKELLEKILQVFNSVGAFCILEGTDRTFLSGNVEDMVDVNELSPEDNEEIARWKYFLSEPINACDIKDRTDADVVPKMMFLLKHAADQEVIKEALGKDFHVITFMPEGGTICNGELISRTDTKGTAIRKTAEYLGVDISDTIAFGDSMNDLPMIEAAGCGVAMGNAEECLKAIADRVCETVEEDGVIRELERMGLI